MKTITVVMALYKPNLKWLEEELCSIGNQTYKDFEILIWNDCPEDDFNYSSLLKKTLNGIPYTFFKGEKNMGSNWVFEHLTALVQSPYIAYCDQDDVWLPEKLNILKETIEEVNVDLVCSDMLVIDGNSNVIATSIDQMRYQQERLVNDHVFEQLISKNFVTRCTILMRTKCAQAAIPFVHHIYHDYWLAIYAAMHRGIYKYPKPLIKYRIYGGNQTSTLKGICTKEDYYEYKILKDDEKFKEIQLRIPAGSDYRIILDSRIGWVKQRIQYFKNPTVASFVQLYRNRRCNRAITFFELVIPLMPSFLFKKVVKLIQMGKIR